MEAGGDVTAALPFACAIEMVHTYSLIHDDLPIMDNDDLRRGKPTCHKVYGDCTAALAGDALQAAAFYTILKASLPDKVKADAGAYLAYAAGEMGMCGGQELDTSEDIRTLEGLTNINDLKTGALLRAACAMGVIAAGDKATDEMLKAAESYGDHLARAFQIRDDILDIISTDDELGKPVGSDESNNKPTFASILGVDESEQLVLSESEMAKSALKGHFADTLFFDALADTLAKRNH
jgi:geranylgeranyl pyrophosphate synthase